MLTDEAIAEYKKAGQVSAEALAFGEKLIKPGVSLVEVADKVEEFVRSKGCGMAFPVNLSMNSAAAHDTAFPKDVRVFKDELVKLDVGAHSNGYVGDNALTVDLSGANAELVKAAREALNNAIKIIQIGTPLGEIGKTIQETIQSYGFEPVRNLSGHQLDRYVLHCGFSIPNYNTNDPTPLEKGMVIAVEPFATTGVGLIGEKGLPGIYSQTQKRPVRSTAARKVLAEVENNNGLPFASRWLAAKNPMFGLGIRELLQNNIIRAYAPLVEKSGGLVSQAEHTLLIDDKVIVLTKGDFEI